MDSRKWSCQMGLYPRQQRLRLFRRPQQAIIPRKKRWRLLLPQLQKFKLCPQSHKSKLLSLPMINSPLISIWLQHLLIVMRRVNCICEYEALNSLAEPWVQEPPLLVPNIQPRWIVVAPNRKNLRGRFVEHVGFWSPRHGVTLQRQIVLNVPRIKYWISCGAVPSARIQKICSIWNILPKPWFQQSNS